MVVTRSLLRAALHDPEREWVEEACITALSSSDISIRSAGVTGLGHLARRFGVLDFERVSAALSQVREDPKMSGLVDDMLGEITFHLERDRS
jgi:hypothetical protein